MKLFSLLVAFSFLVCPGQAQTPSFQYQVVTWSEVFKPGSDQVSVLNLETRETPSGLKAGYKMDMVSKEGSRYAFEYVKQNPSLSNPGNTVIVVKPMSDVSKLSQEYWMFFYLVPAGANLPAPPGSGGAMELPPSPSPEPVVFTALFDGNTFEGFAGFNMNLYYEQGNPMFENPKQPVLILAFTSSAQPDNRQFTITIPNFTGKTGTYPAAEVLLSGAASGLASEAQLQGYKPGQGNSFTVEITDWNRETTEKAIISLNLSGTLKGVFGAQDVKVTDGRVMKAEVRCFAE